MRKLASIQRITDIAPIEGADKIEVASILGWKVVIPKGQYNIGDLVVYCEVDSLLPRTEWSEFLFKSAKEDVTKYRLKTIKLKKQISQGIVFPLSILPKIVFNSLEEAYNNYIEGDDVTENLEIEKYEPYIPAQLQGLIKGNFPSWIPKTDETRIQSVPNVLERHKGKLFVVTEKLDGSSMTAYYDENGFGVCSRNLDLKESEGNAYWSTARKLKLEEKLKKYYNDSGKKIVLQGELIGQGIQKNRYGLAELDFKVFNILLDGRYVCHDEMTAICLYFQLDTVPHLSTITLNHTVDELVEMSKIVSKLNKCHAEGLVFRSLVEDRDEELGRLSFKVINPEFLLAHGE